MPRNLDLTALRAFATVAAAGGVTRAAARLNLTQSAVSMQLKRLEEALDARLMERTGRGVVLTPQGEAALGVARRMLALNDDLVARMKNAEPEGVIRLGVPHDIVPRQVPAILRAFADEYPGVRIDLISSVTTALHRMFAEGACDVILTTETEARPGGEELARLPLVWVGAPDGRAWTERPLRLAFETECIFRAAATAALDAAGIPWELAVTASSSRAIDASVSADLAVHAVIDGFDTPEMQPVPHDGALPEIGETGIMLHVADGPGQAPVAARERLVAITRDIYGALRPTARRPRLAVG